jgi:hypothetical protein
VRLLALLFLLGVSAFGQAISTPGASTLQPNQVTVSTSYLYYNKMHYAGAWSSSATYSSQDVVSYSGATYVSLQTANLNITPGTNILFWVSLGGSGGSASWGGISGTLSAQTDLAAALAAKEPSITAGTTVQYWRGDKSWQTFSAAVWAQLSGSTPIVFNNATGAFSCPSCLTSSMVTSVFARTGAVVASSGDYTAAQVTNAVDSTGSYSNPAWITGLAWSKITGAPAFAANTGAVSHQFFTAYNSTTGAFSAAQPAFTDISGSVAAAQLPNPSASTLGGIQSITSLAHNWIASISTLGVPVQAQPAFTDISGTATAAQVPASVRVRAIGYTFDGGGSALTSGLTRYLTVPFACTLSAWNIAVDTGTATLKTWKVGTGTAVPTVSNTLSTSGVSIASGTAIHSATMTDFSSTTVTANDIFGFNLYAVSTATQVNFILECDQ